jgi:signal transduction histidine kinase
MDMAERKLVKDGPAQQENARLREELRKALAEVGASQERIIRTERLRALGELAEGVAHEFNNILSIILGRAQMLLGKTLDPVLRRNLEVIERVALDGSQTVRRIQEFSRKLPARPFEPVDLNRVIEQVMEITQPRWKAEAQARGLQYDVRMDQAALPPVLGDPAELREALTNLALNALDAMPEGGTLTLRTYQQAGGSGQKAEDASLLPAAGCPLPAVVVEICDTGVGMPDEVKQRLFEPYFTTKGDRGSGLGLSVTYGIISRHGGKIEVHSQVGHGSRFVMWFPFGREIARPKPETAEQLQDVIPQALSRPRSSSPPMGERKGTKARRKRPATLREGVRE